MTKYIFKEDYEANGSNYIPSGSQQPQVALKYSFKKGDIFDGEQIIETHNNVQHYAVTIYTSEGIKLDGKKWSGKAIFEIPEIEVIEQPVTEQTPKGAEVAKQTFLQKHKNHLLIVGALVLGYLAYKKFKK
jgi:uncharacterized protein involved in tellurium resistance